MSYAETAAMSAWEVIEIALKRRKPPRDQAWLAEQLGISEQAVSNWKVRGVPENRVRKLGQILGLSADQVAGDEPPPWEQDEGAWPFPGIDRARFDRLTDEQRIEIQGAVRHLIEKFETEKASLGKSSNSQGGPYRNKAA